jgi:hypothetical protein
VPPWLLKYDLYEILHRKERKGRKAKPTKSFALFAPFAMNQIMISSPHPCFGFPTALLAFTLAGCPS